MICFRSAFSSFSLVVAALAGCASVEGRDGDDDETPVSIGELPSQVRAALERERGGGVVTEVEREIKDGKTVYSADVLIDGVGWDIAIAEDGEVLSKAREESNRETGLPLDRARPASQANPNEGSDGTKPAFFHIERTFSIGGEGGWDLLTVDSDAQRLYVPRGDRVVVIDTESGRVAGEVLGTSGVHGVALSPPLHRGFTSNGRAGTVTVFDLITLQILQTVRVGENPDCILVEPVTRRVLCFNGRSHDVTVLDAENGTVLGTIALGGQPELAVSDGSGRVFVNVESTSEVVRVDPTAITVDKRWPLAPGEGPTGLAIDASRHRLYAACGNQKLVVLDGETGHLLGEVAIGKGVDGAEYDANGGFVLTSNGGGREAGAEATLSVVSVRGDRCELVQTLPTSTRAKTLTFDPKTRRVFVATAEFEPAQSGQTGAPPQRPAMKPGSFKILVISP